MFRQRAPKQATEPKLWICFETCWRALCASGLAKKIETTNASPAAKLFQTSNAHQLVCFKFWFQAVGSKAASASMVPAPKACFKLSSQTAPRRQLSACSQGLFQTLFPNRPPWTQAWFGLGLVRPASLLWPGRVWSGLVRLGPVLPKPANPQNHQTTKPPKSPNHQTSKPPNRQTTKPANHQTTKPPTPPNHQTNKPANHQN